MRATVSPGFFAEPALVAAKFILTEIDYANGGHQSFDAAAPRIDWMAVKMQLLYLHGCAKITRDADS